MSSRTAAARKRLQHPPPKVSPELLVAQPYPFTPATLPDKIPSTSRTRDAPRTSIQRLDLSNEFTQPLPSPELASPEYSPTYFPPSNHANFRNIDSNQAVEAVPSYGPFLHPKSNHRKSKYMASGQTMRAAPTYEPSSPYEEDMYQSRRPMLRVDPHGMTSLLPSNYIDCLNLSHNSREISKFTSTSISKSAGSHFKSNFTRDRILSIRV
jgi:hypothetical protein